MPSQDTRDLFDFMLNRVTETQKEHLDGEPQAFGRWFAELFFINPRDLFVSDGSKDGKIDLFFTTHNGKSVLHHVLNTKYTKEFNKLAPPSFYEEIKYFWQAFENRAARSAYLEKAVKAELRPRYNQLFERYDNGAAELMFVTNHRRNEAHFEQVRNVPVKVFHLDDLIQCLVDDIDGAMPRTPPISSYVPQVVEPISPGFSRGARGESTAVVSGGESQELDDLALQVCEFRHQALRFVVANDEQVSLNRLEDFDDPGRRGP